MSGTYPSEWTRRPTPIADRIPMRLRLAWACLRGRPVAYRMTIAGGLHVSRNTMIVECAFQKAGTGTVAAVSIAPDGMLS